MFCITEYPDWFFAVTAVAKWCAGIEHTFPTMQTYRLWIYVAGMTNTNNFQTFTTMPLHVYRKMSPTSYPQISYDIFISLKETSLCFLGMDLSCKCQSILSSTPLEVNVLKISMPFLCVYFSLQDLIMYDFECHYREERWQTARYFDFVKDFLIAAQNREDSDDCDPPLCPTTPHTTTTEQYSKGKHLLCGLPVVFC